MNAAQFEAYFVDTWTNADTHSTKEMAIFWEAIFVYCLLLRLHLIYRIATDETFARKTFGAYGQKTILRVCAGLASSDEIIIKQGEDE